MDPINGQFGGDASCGVQVGVGTYQVSIPSQWMVGDVPVFVSGADSWVQKVTLNPGDSPTLSFSTSDNPDLTVDISGPSCFGVDCFENDWANGVPVTVQQVDSSGNPIG